jgi:CheY-like chemotaxis protein
MLKGKSLWEQLRPLLAKVPAARGKENSGPENQPENVDGVVSFVACNLAVSWALLVVMAHIMVIAESEFTANAIEQALTQRGHLVTTATDFNHIESSCAGLVFDLVVLGLNIPSKVKQAILLQVREYCDGTPVLDMCLPGACVTGADLSLASDSFEALASAVTAMLQKQKRKIS